MPVTSVSAVELVSALCLNLPIQTVGWFVYGWNPSDSAAHAKH